MVRVHEYLPLLLLILLVIPSLLPLIRPGFFTMHDDQQVVRLYELDRALAAGQFPARWVGNLGFGFGYPLFIFYPPFAYYLGEIFHLLLATSFIGSVKLVFVFAFLGAAITMYLWVKEHFGRSVAVIAAVFYTYVPYHAVDAYVRGALAELTTLVWLPAILWSTDRLILKGNKKYLIWLGVLLALLMITHNLIFLSFFPLFIIYVLFLVSRVKEKRKSLFLISYSLLLTFGLSAFFWLPALIERKYTLVDSILLTELASYTLHFVYPTQLWNSLWGYGGSTQGTLDGLSFKIGKLHIVLSALAIVGWLVIARLRKEERYRRTLFHCSIVSLLFVISGLMTMKFSQPIWDLARPLQYLQFPWRFLTFTSLFSSFLAGAAISAFFTLMKSHLLKAFMTVVVLALLTPNLKLFRPQSYLEVDDSSYTSDEFIKWKISKTSFEFVPREVKTITEYNEVEQREITQVDISRDQITTPPYRIISGSPSIGIKRNVPGKLDLQVSNPQGIVLTTLELSIFDFPGWEVRIDGKKVRHSSENDLRLITVSVPAGDRLVEARFRDTPVRTLANLISLSSMIFLGIQMKWGQHTKDE